MESENQKRKKRSRDSLTQIADINRGKNGRGIHICVKKDNFFKETKDGNRNGNRNRQRNRDRNKKTMRNGNRYRNCNGNRNINEERNGEVNENGNRNEI